MSSKQFNFYITLIFILISVFISSAKAATNDNDIEKFFDWAQSEYSVYFDSPASTKTFDVWRYRYYPNTDNYLGVNNLNEVYVLGPSFGGLLFVGMLNDFLSLIPENFVYIQKVAEIGMPAAGFPENFIYYNVRNPGMGPNGEIAFSGAADISHGSTDANTNAVWTGRPGNLEVIIRENDTIPGLPGNVLFYKKAESSATKPPVITQSGHVAFAGGLKGAVSDHNNDVILAYVNGEIKKVIREGDPAPGFPIGTSIGPLVHHAEFSFSEAGMIISGTVDNLQPALWFWDFNSLTLLAAGSKSTFNVFPLSEAIEFPYQGCEFGAFGTPLINDNGTIVVASLIGLSENKDCTDFSISSLLRIKNSDVSILLDSSFFLYENDHPGNLPMYPLFSYDLNALDGISFNLGLKSGKTSSTWYKYQNGNYQLVSFFGETLPNDFTTFLSEFPQDVIVNENSESVVYGIDNTGAKYILFGKPRPHNFYNSAYDAGKSQLSLVAKTGMQPPGLSVTDFFREISQPILTKNGDIIFAARVESAIDGSNYQSLWRAKPDGTLYRLTYDGQIIKDGSSDEPVSFRPNQESFFRGIGNGQPNRFSNTGKVVFQGDLSNSWPIYLLSYYD